MATFTEHYDFIKPGTDDYYDVADFNENMDAIDTQLYQAEQDMAGVSEKIGNPGDEGTDTIFGLLHPKNQPEEKEDFYRYSKTDIKKHILNWEIYPEELEDPTSFYAKLTTLHAEKNGMIYMKLDTEERGLMHFGIYDKAPEILSRTPDQSIIGTTVQDFQYQTNAWFYIEYHNTSYNATPKTSEFVIPVTAGVDYTFVYFGNTIRKSIVKEFIVGYTDTKEA